MDAYFLAIAAMIGWKLNVLRVRIIATKSPADFAVVELLVGTCSVARLLQKQNACDCPGNVCPVIQKAGSTVVLARDSTALHFVQII